VLTYEIPLPLSVHPRQMDRALSLDISNHLRYRVLGRYRDHHVYMVRPQMPFFNLALLLLGQPPEDFPQMPPQFLVQSFATTFRDENDMVFALPLRMR
jgi:hypothetical protein